MEKCCEVCENFRPGAKFGSNYRVLELEFDVRPVRLCVGHARIAQNSGVRSFEELRELYGAGRRSFVPRRGSSATHAGYEPRSAGRRASDASC
jgi:hypothetical protein